MEEKLKILQLVRDGKVNPEQGLELLDAIGKGAAPRIVEDFVGPQGGARRLRITSVSKKGNEFAFSIPLGMIRFADKLFPSRIFFKVQGQQLDVEQIMERIHQGEKGILYEDEDENVRLELV